MRLNKKNENLYSSSHRKITSNAQNSWTNVTVIRPSAQLIQKYCTVCTAKFNFGKIVITSSHYLSCLSQSANHTAQNDWPIVIAYKYYFPLLIFFSIQLQIYRRVSNSQRMCWFADLQTSSGQVILYCCSFFVFFCLIFVYQCLFGEIKIIIYSPWSDAQFTPPGSVCDDAGGLTVDWQKLASVMSIVRYLQT